MKMITPRKIISSYNTFANPINKKIQTYLRRSNVPAFSMMMKKLTMETFFYNHDLLEKAVGKNMVLLNNLVYDCLVDALVDSIYNAVNNTTDTINPSLVGWWTKASITDMVRMGSTFCPCGDNDELYFISYGFAGVDQETLDKILAGEDPNIKAMKFADFSQDKFNVVVNQIVENTVVSIMNMQKAVWPTAYCVDSDEKLDDKLIAMFYKSLKTIKDDEMEKGTNEEVSKQDFAIACVMRALTLFVSSIMADGGVELDIVKSVLENTSINYWPSEIKKGKSSVTGTCMMYALESAPNEIFVQVEFQNSLAISCVYNPESELTKTLRSELGRKLRRVISDFCSYTFAASAD